jgi:ribosomal protein S18 acetylase RimI-like enzyme
MIYLENYKDEHYASLDYSLPEEQSKFTSSIAQCISAGATNHFQKKIATVFFQDIPIGFFVLDNSNDKLQLTDNLLAVSIRSFSIHPHYQGKGIGKEAMILVSEYVKKNFSNTNELVLSVNVKNTHAYRTYLKAGFTDIGKCIDGIMGPQNILSKKIEY